MGWIDVMTVSKRLSYFKNLAAIAVADGVVRESERQYLASIGVRCGLATADIEEVINHPSDEIEEGRRVELR